MKALSFLLVLTSSLLFAPPKTSKDVLKRMYKKYYGHWFKTFTFNQTTENYRNDSLVKTSTWYEAIEYPTHFRIDFGDPKKGNGVIYSKDSAYNFRDGKLGKVTVNNDDLTFLLGGMYFYPFDSVLNKLQKLGYNLDHFHMDKWKGQDVFVIGANDQNEKLNQVWIDKEKMLLVRFIKFDKDHKEEGILEGHKKFDRGWSETKCTFYINNKLFQKETYHDCQANSIIDSRVFDPHYFGKVHWSKTFYE